MTWSSHLHYSDWLLCCFYLLLREGMSAWPIPGHPLGQKTATLAELPPHCPSKASQVAEWIYIHGHSQLVPRVAVKSCRNVFRPCPLCTRPCHCHSMSAWLKQVCMHRAMPQLSETEMGFDFRNPVAWVHPGPLTQTCWQSRSAESKQTEVLLCAAVLTGTKNLIKLCVFIHILALSLLFEKTFRRTEGMFQVGGWTKTCFPFVNVMSKINNIKDFLVIVTDIWLFLS